MKKYLRILGLISLVLSGCVGVVTLPNGTTLFIQSNADLDVHSTSTVPTTTPNPTSTSVPTTHTATPTQDVQDLRCFATVLGTDYLNIRSGPGTQYAIVGQALTGDRITVEGKTWTPDKPAEIWVEIYDGYLASWLVALDNSPNCESMTPHAPDLDPKT